MTEDYLLRRCRELGLLEAEHLQAEPDDLIDRVFNARVTVACIAAVVVIVAVGGFAGWMGV